MLTKNIVGIDLAKIKPSVIAVKGYLEGHKTDKNDALAIPNAAIQIGIKFSQPKPVEQQTLHSLETSRQFLTRSIVSLGDHVRAIMSSSLFPDHIQGFRS